MYCATLSIGAKPHKLSDDLESFLHVVVYNLMRYLPSDYKTAALVDDFKIVYDTCITDGDVRYGGKGKAAFFRGSSLLVNMIQGLPDGCVDLVATLRDTFRIAFYDLPSTRRNPTQVEVEAKNSAIDSLSTSTLFLDTFQNCLDDKNWDEDDGLSAGKDQLTFPSEPAAGHVPVKSKKRKKPTKKHRPNTKASSASTRGTHTQDITYGANKKRRIVTSSKGTWAPTQSEAAQAEITGNELSEKDSDDDA
ncbi:hypothetical protein OF83DRAFT_1056547 [Amylostereum chailletii]|nr:hypothetical protein OF83DRAFT_1056547 [Amylostereum chailletii]